MGVEAYLPSPGGFFEGIGEVIGGVARTTVDVLNSPQLRDAVSGYLTYQQSQAAQAAQRQAAADAAAVASARARAQVRVLNDHPELVYSYPPPGVDPGGYLNGYYSGTNSPLYVAPGSPAPDSGTSAPPIQAGAGSDQLILLLVGAFALMVLSN
jgi:hypothetical protein